MSHTVLLIGCGNMGFAMLSGWLSNMPGLNAFVVEPNEALRLRAQTAGAAVFADVGSVPVDVTPDLVVVAVKPQTVAAVLAECGRFAASGATFVSVAAGITIGAMASALPEGAPIIRCMPNTPAAIGQGMLVFCAGAGVSEGAMELTETMFRASGEIAWIDDESLMDAVTAISGSGPAYVFHFIEALTAAGRALGLPEETAALLARQTVAGSGAYARASQVAPGTLREQVTSPGGTTAAALEVFMTEGRFSRLVLEAATAARNRGIELGK